MNIHTISCISYLIFRVSIISYLLLKGRQKTEVFRSIIETLARNFSSVMSLTHFSFVLHMVQPPISSRMPKFVVCKTFEYKNSLKFMVMIFYLYSQLPDFLGIIDEIRLWSDNFGLHAYQCG